MMIKKEKRPRPTIVSGPGRWLWILLAGFFSSPSFPGCSGSPTSLLPDHRVEFGASLPNDGFPPLTADLGVKHRTVTILDGFTSLSTDLGKEVRPALRGQRFATFFAYLAIVRSTVSLFSDITTKSSSFTNRHVAETFSRPAPFYHGMILLFLEPETRSTKITSLRAKNMQFLFSTQQLRKRNKQKLSYQKIRGKSKL